MSGLRRYLADILLKLSNYLGNLSSRLRCTKQYLEEEQKAKDRIRRIFDDGLAGRYSSGGGAQNKPESGI